MLDKKKLLKWIEQEIHDEGWQDESGQLAMRTVRNFILRGLFDIKEEQSHADK